MQAPLTLRIRAGAAYADAESRLSSGANPEAETVLRRLESAEEVSERLTASAHAASVRWDSADTNGDFVSQCRFCHQIGSESTRVAKS